MTVSPTETDEAENERHREKARKHKAARDKIMATKTGEKGLLIVNTGTGRRRASTRRRATRSWQPRPAKRAS